MEVFRWWSVLWLCFMSGWVSASEPVSRSVDSPNIVGAVCVIRHGNQMVVQSEVITQKFSLPGGYIDKGDTPQQAAAREALEETGIDVAVGPLIQYRGHAAIFACVAKSPILVSSYPDQRGFSIVASWFSPHFSTEIERVYLIDPDDIDASEYRYDKDAKLLPAWLEKTPESDILVYERLDDQANILDQFEIRMIDNFQNAIKQWSPRSQHFFDIFVAVLNMPGEAWFICILLLCAVSFCGQRIFLELLFFLLLSLFISSLLKHVMASPRPFFIVPELQKVAAYGFGFPSTHTLLATLLWGMLWHRLSRQLVFSQKVLLASVALLLMLGQGMARVWFGVHFVSDVIISIMLGLIIISALNVWRAYERSSLQACLSNRWFWFFATMAVGIVMSYSMAPFHVYIFAIMLGVFLSVEYSVQVDINQPSLSWQKSLVVCGGITVVLAVLYWGFYYLAAQQTVSLIVLTIKGIGCVIMTMWLLAGSAWIKQKLSS
ncbi:bifunctional NUDIX hydrolase/phosphatase PAP2 family protein [Photobacterium nomapromontoriensis]|uniref:bifunctional NUDIX hydrolase/phosphatase PAP2 family protein n=1 Tax=Photobacterium nomapromontoriensis TaxID=2910237 RepID=UPI003D10ECEE